jgi:hypothetical protein
MQSLLHADPEVLRLAHPPRRAAGRPRTYSRSKRRRAARRRIRIAVLGLAARLRAADVES